MAWIRIRAGGLTLVLALCAAGTDTSLAATATFRAPVIQQEITALAATKARVFVSGDLSQVGASTGFVVLGPKGARDRDVPTVNGNAISAPDGHGGWYVSGEFTRAGSLRVDGLAHILRSGRLDPRWSPVTADDRKARRYGDVPVVTALAYAGGRVYLAGAFTSVDGVRRVGLAAVDARTGQLERDFRPDATLGSDAEVDQIVATPSRVFLEGDTLGALRGPDLDVVSLDARTGRSVWGLRDESLDGEVNAIGVGDGRLFVVGEFDSVAGLRQPDAVALFPESGRVDRRWRPALEPNNLSTPQGDQPEYQVGLRSVAVSEGRVYLAGQLFRADGLTRTNVAAVDPRRGRVLRRFEANATGSRFTEIDALALAGRRLFLIGTSRQSSNPSERIAAVDALTGRVARVWSSPRSKPSNLVDGSADTPPISTSGGRVMVGGTFPAPGTVLSRAVIALSRRTGTLERSFKGPRLGRLHDGGAPSINALAPAGNDLVIGGDFTAVGSLYRNDLALLDRRGRPISAFAARANGEVTSVAVAGQRIIITGSFTYVDGVRRDGVAAVDLPSGTLDTNFAPVVDPGSAIASLLVGHGRVYLGGKFNLAGHRDLVAVTLSSGSPVPGWKPQPNGAVTAILASGSHVFVAGDFTRVSGVGRDGLAELGSHSAAAQRTFAPRLRPECGVIAENPYSPQSTCLPASSLGLRDGELFVGGWFDIGGGRDVGLLSAFAVSSGKSIRAPRLAHDTGNVNALATIDGRLLIGASAGFPPDDASALQIG